MDRRSSAESNHELFGVPFHSQTSRYEMMEKIVKEEVGTSYWTAWDTVQKEHVTVKRYIRGPHADESVTRDVHNQRALLHPHITRMREIVVGKLSFDVVMDFAPGRNLAYYADQFAPLSERHARHFLQQLVIAVDFCHRRGQCVGNICLDNLALNSELDIVKLQNPRLGKSFVEQSKSRSLANACDYASPETVSSEGVKPEDGCAVDVWAIGVCLFALLYGYMPFSDEKHDTDATRVANTRARILARRLEVPDRHIEHPFRKKRISANCLDLLYRLLEHDPRSRIAIPEVMQHPWFLKGLPEGALELNDSIERADATLPELDKGKRNDSIVRRFLSCGFPSIK